MNYLINAVTKTVSEITLFNSVHDFSSNCFDGGRRAEKWKQVKKELPDTMVASPHCGTSQYSQRMLGFKL